MPGLRYNKGQLPAAGRTPPGGRRRISHRKEEGGETALEDLVRLCAQPIAYAGAAIIFLGLIYLGIQLKDGCSRGGGELRKAVAMIAAGGAVIGFVSLYGFSGF